MNAEKIYPFLGLIKSIRKGFQQKLLGRYDSSRVASLIAYSNHTFEALWPEIPEVDEKSPWLKNIVVVAYEISLWLQLEKLGMTLPEISRLTCEVLDGAMRQIPPAVREEMKKSSLLELFVSKFAEDSETLNPVCNWRVSRITPEVGDSFEIGMDILSCPIVRMCETLGVRRFSPFLCKNDFVTYKAIGIRLTRTQTLADGDAVCDFRLSDITADNKN